MEKQLPLEECSLRQIFFDAPQTFIIPIYQRNYAWGEDEIMALVKDVYDSSAKDRNTPYFIGTLVTYRRGDAEYEVIDGQQRLTTIYIILKALGVKGCHNKLTYRARKASASTIENLDNYPDLGEEFDSGIRNGYVYAEKALDEIVGNENRENFKDYFLEKVKIIHYHVPKDVDLNHYFEVMNSRGEQLEKHEIVKSLLLQWFKDQAGERSTFSRVWEACSEMNVYIQQIFPFSEVFGKNMNMFNIRDFSGIPSPREYNVADSTEEGGKNLSIRSLFNQNCNKKGERGKDEKPNDKFQPIIDFPNFLLIVLKLTRMDYDDFKPADFILDDKELINEFNKALGTVDDKNDFVRKFTFNLLKAKFLLDNYIVHHELSDKESSGDNPWKLQALCLDSQGKKYPENLMSALGSKDNNAQDELVHLLSMFEVSFSPKQRKNYLFYCLKHLFDSQEPEGYLCFLRSLSRKYFYCVYLNKACLNDRNQPKPNAFDDVLLQNRELKVNEADATNYKGVFKAIYKQGDIPLFVFNYTDYILWRLYAKTLRGMKIKEGAGERKMFFDKLGCSDFGLKPFDNFYFSRTRKSLEHFYPRAKAAKEGEDALKEINCFGNFAMIGADANISGSNWDPKTKLDHYLDSKTDPVSTASLKFRVMMQICKDNQQNRESGMEWYTEDMEEHQSKMLDLIVSPDPF